MKRLLVILSGVIIVFSSTLAQNTDEWNGQLPSQNTITTAVPFLNIGPDARSGGMGELGAATQPDPMSQHWNV